MAHGGRFAFLVLLVVEGGLLASRGAFAQVTVRTQEPIVIRASQFPGLAGADISKIRLYRNTPTGWELIPFQIDEYKVDSLQVYQTGSCAVSAESCEWNVIVDGSGPGTFSDRDELVFMARDVGTGASSSDWVGAAGVDTESTRYRIRVFDDVDRQDRGYAFLYLWKTTPPPVSSTDYVSWTETSADAACVNQLSVPTSTDAACGWFRSTDQGSIAGLPRFNAFMAGNWTTGAMCVKPYATDASCTVADSTTNMLDQFKWRTTLPREQERGWDRNCRALIGVKDGPVRVVRRTIGAQSGRFTTKTDYFYGTWWEQKLNLRVHTLGSITMSIDHQPKGVSGEAPAYIFTATHSGANTNLPMDALDLGGQGAGDGAFGDWLQVDLSRGTYLQFFRETRAIGRASRSFVYSDSAEGDAPEYVDGTLGEAGFAWTGSSCIASTQDVVCIASDPESASLQFASMTRTLVPLAVDGASGAPLEYRSEEGEKYAAYVANPLIDAIAAETYATSPPPPPGTCSPVITGVANSGGFSTSLTVSTANCATLDAVGVRVYRGTAPGIYQFLEDIGNSGSFLDATVKAGTTYRYVARAYNADADLSAASTELQLSVVDNVAPPIPQGLAAVPGSHQVVISWTPPEDRDTQEVVIEVAAVETGPFVVIAPQEPVCGGGTVVINGLTPGQTRWYRLRAKDEAGNVSDPSPAVSATPLP